MVEIVSNCVGCETCTKFTPCTQEIHRCDECNRILSHKIYRYDGAELCYECCFGTIAMIAKENLYKIVDDMFDDLCDYFEIEEEDV